MKRLLGTILALTIFGVVAAQTSEVEFNITVDPIMAIALGTDSTNNVEISYNLEGDEFMTMDQTSFELRYITNRVGDPAEIEQADCILDWDQGEVKEFCDDPRTALAGQFIPSYITIAAGGSDDDGLYEVAAFTDALRLGVQTAGSCLATATANNFAVPDGFEEYTESFTFDGEEYSKTWDAVDFTEAQKAWAASHVGTSQAGGEGLELTFDGTSAFLIGDPNDADSLIRGAVCGEVAGEGWEITLTPVRVGATILPAGTTPVAVEITIHDHEEGI